MPKTKSPASKKKTTKLNSSNHSNTRTRQPRLALEQVAPVNDFSNLSVVTAAGGPEARLHVWALVNGLTTAVGSRDGDNLEISVSAEVFSSESVWLRALVDGRVAQPSDVLFKSGNVDFDGVRSFTFVLEGVSGGQHLVEIQALAFKQTRFGDRSLTVNSAPPGWGASRLAVVAAPSGPSINAPASYANIPHLETFITTDAVTTLGITFSAETGATSGRMMVRAMVDNVQIGEVIFIEAGDSQRSGTRSFTFVQFALPVGVHNIKLQWRSGSGSSWIGDRTMSVSAVRRTSQVVTIAEPPDPVSLTQTNWVDFHLQPNSPGTIIETTESVSNVAIAVSSEVLATGGRILFRALLDGEPVSPSDVAVIKGGNKWRSTAYTFVAKNVKRGRHRVKVQMMVDPQTTAKLRRRSTRILFKRRRGPDFVQPFLEMTPRTRRIRLLVIGFDPVRPEHPRPSFAQIRNAFEGNPGVAPPELMALTTVLDRGPNFVDWLKENSGGQAIITEVRYLGCFDNQWYVAPPERQGNWYFDNKEFEQMYKDALSQADAEVDFHGYDTDQDNRLSYDELLVALVRPQNVTDGFVRDAVAVLDGNPTPLVVPVLDLYMSSLPAQQRANVGIIAHEASHHVFGATHLISSCAVDIGARKYSVMSTDWPLATHLDPFMKMKNGLVQPVAIDLDTQLTMTFALSAVELRHQILILHDSAHVSREYFVVENRYPGTLNNQNHDFPIGTGAIVVWQIFEDERLVQSSAICPGDGLFIRKRAVLSKPAHSFDLAWADGSPAGFRLTAPIPNAELAQLKLEKL